MAVAPSNSMNRTGRHYRKLETSRLACTEWAAKRGEAINYPRCSAISGNLSKFVRVQIQIETVCITKVKFDLTQICLHFNPRTIHDLCYGVDVK